MVHDGVFPMTTPRISNPMKLAPATIKAMLSVEATFAGLDPLLAELVKLRASQINGCAPCLQMHIHEARKHGEREMRLHMLPAWRESSLYSERERAALGWTEALTRVSDTHAPDEAYAPMAAVFSEEEQVLITLLIGSINAWNRLNIAFRVRPIEATSAEAA